MKKRKLCIITGSRAEWGLFYPLAKEIKRNKGLFTLQIIATGAHLSSDFGLTYKEIERDGFEMDCKVKMLFPGDTEETISRSVSRGITGLTKALKLLKPDLVFLLGDRFETFSAAIASFFLRIPIAHIHGGELTEGSLDDSLRHSITKLSYLHFTSADAYRKRIIQLGEDPKRVFNVGALGLDNIANTKLLNRKEVEEKINFKLGNKNIMITYNPSTADKKEVSERELKSLLKAADGLSDAKVIFTKPSADIHSRKISRLIDRYVYRKRDRAASFTSMGRELYLSALQFMDVVAGNSSSGIIEAPSFGIPTINIGRREHGRIKPTSIIDVEGNPVSVGRAFKKAFSKSFKRHCKMIKNPYGDGNASKRIMGIVKETDFSKPKKEFFDWDII